MAGFSPGLSPGAEHKPCPWKGQANKVDRKLMWQRAELADRDVAGLMQRGSIKLPPRSLAGRIKCQFSALLKR